MTVYIFILLYFDRYNFALTHLTDQYSRKHKLSIAVNPNCVSYKCLKCFDEQKENYDLKKLACELETTEVKKYNLEKIRKKFRVKTVSTANSNLIRHLKTRHDYESVNSEEEN